MTATAPAGWQAASPPQRTAAPGRAPRGGQAPPPGGYRAQLRWEHRYVRVLILFDAAACVAATGVAYVIRFGGFLHFEMRATSPRWYLLATVLLPLVWGVAMSLNRAYEPRFLGGGSEEFRRVVNAAMRVVATVATVSYVTKAEIARAYVLVVFPVAILLTVAGRIGGRGLLHRARRQGRCMHRVLVVGAGESAAMLVRLAQRDPTAGWSVVGVVLDRSPGRHSSDRPERSGFDLLGVPIVGTTESLHTSIRATRATTVAISPQVDGGTLQRMLWNLEGSDVEVLVSSALTDVVGPRISIRPVAGLPLLHVEEPELTGSRRVMKMLFDRAVALSIVLFFSPLLLGLALAVRLNSRGPAIFKQVRVGRGGQPFKMYKFRSMYVDAEARLVGLRTSNEGQGLLFKMRDDPRVTGVGKFLRKWSLDELPQLFNVLRGDMSLVGPRPPLPSEVAAYEGDVHRRLMVKPGLTGLWQISGRSDLAWDESVRLDLRYVENWTLAMDFVILWRTVFAVLRREGAY
ncbi:MULTISPECIES: sugar transferase [Pseudofrankia]|uniref:sugar transferase n=1 Tax=Pseudofrankia TaxID=2994363 RepID=UPI000234C01D|nr:UDP-phosphate galactose phosphotransferase [Pseudofrankia sp. EUN1h]